MYALSKIDLSRYRRFAIGFVKFVFMRSSQIYLIEFLPKYSKKLFPSRNICVGQCDFVHDYYFYFAFLSLPVTQPIKLVMNTISLLLEMYDIYNV